MADGIMGLVGTLFPKKQKNESITAPEDSPFAPMHDEIKSSGLKANQIDQIFSLVNKGIMPGTKQFSDALGIGMEQNGLAPTSTFGPFGAIRDAFSPKAKNIIAQQQVADKIGGLVLGQVVEMKQRQALGPQSLQEAEQLLPGVIRPVESQRGATLDQIVGQGTQGPTQAVDPNAPLTPAQQQLAGATLESLGKGQLMQSPEGIVPTSFATVQGRSITPQQLQFGAQAATTPVTEPLPIAPSNIPASLANKIIEERGQMQRMLQKGPDFNNRLESLTAVESSKRFGAPLNFAQVAQKDPAFANQLRQQAEIQESKDIFSYQQNEMMKRAVAQAGPVATAKFEAEKDQPVDQPQLWRDPVTMKAASAQMTTRQAQNRNFVKLRPDQVETLNQMETIDKGLSEVKKIAEKVLSPKRKTALGEGWRALSQSARLAYLRATGDEDMLKMDSMITRLTAPLVKSQGDAANIAVAEREMFAQSLVNNRASTEAVLANLDNVISTTKSVRGMMGFTDKNEFESALVQSGMKSKDAADLAKKRFKAEARLDQREQIRALRAQGKDWNEIEKILTNKR